MTIEWSLRELIAFAETWSAFNLSRQDPSAARTIDAALASVIAEVGAMRKCFGDWRRAPERA
jgi:hypothetical protein